MMFSLLTLLLLTLAAAKQDCPICRDHSSYSSSSYGSSNVRDSCSRAISSSNNSPCPDGKVCKVFNAGMSSSVGYSYYSVSIKQIDCYHPSDSCMSKFGPSMQCTESYLFNPDKCPGCMITQARISGVEYTAEDTCNYDSSQWHSCNRGVSCNFLKLTGRLTSTSSYSDTVTAYILGCGLDYSDCRVAENALNTVPGLTISRCSDGEFPKEWNP